MDRANLKWSTVSNIKTREGFECVKLRSMKIKWLSTNNSNDQTYSNETSLCLIECISVNDTVFNIRGGLYTGRVERTCIGHHI